MRATGLLKVRYASKSRKETNTVYFYLSSITFYANPMQQQQHQHHQQQNRQHENYYGSKGR